MKMIYKNIPDYFDFIWDTMDYKKREDLMLFQAIETVIFAKKTVPFYKEHYKNLSEDKIRNIKTLEEFAFTIPEISKIHLSSNSFKAFLPYGKEPENLMGNKGTGGTTGKPVTTVFSSEDWRAMTKYVARTIGFAYRKNL